MNELHVFNIKAFSEPMQPTAKQFADFAAVLVANLPATPYRTEMLVHLLAARDAAIHGLTSY